MSAEKRLSRRAFLHASALTAVGAALAACAQPTPQVIEKEVPVEKIVQETVVVEKQVPVEKTVKETVVVEKEKVVEKVVTATPVPSKYKEAPMLAELVKAGKLPPVDERLPQNPTVLPVMEMVGTYGGTMRRGFNGVSDSNGPWKVTSNQMIWYNADLSLRPSVCESWEINQDASEWTFKLRKGMRWSDGTPFTTDDWTWWYDNILMNQTLTPSISASWSTGQPRVPMQLNVIDQYTATLKFAAPNPLFVYVVTNSDPYAPGFYLKQFHYDLVTNKAAIDKATKDAGYSTWDQYFAEKNSWFRNPELPTTHTWNAVNQIQEELFVMERNPYFYQVDEDGNQLPYIDRVTHRLFNTVDVFNMWIVGGEIDYQQRHVNVANYTLFKENEAKGDYKVVIGADDSTDTIALNHTVQNDRMRELFWDRDVRYALSLAVDREQINELVFDGLTTPRQYSPPTQSPEYYPKLTEAYTAYDPQQANALLDKAGYTAKDSDGFRKWKDGSGETISLIFQTYTLGLEDEAAIIIKNWADVGIKATYKVVERSLGEAQGRANEVEIEHHKCSRAVLPLVDPAFFIGAAQDKSWCKAWTLWYNNPKAENAEEPPADHFIRKMWDLWSQIKLEPSGQKQHELMLQIFDVLAVEIPMPGTVGEFPAPIIVKNGLRNLDPKYVMPISNPTKHGCFIPMQTYFWEDPTKHS